jgi:hypothetical protein
MSIHSLTTDSLNSSLDSSVGTNQPSSTQGGGVLRQRVSSAENSRELETSTSVSTFVSGVFRGITNTFWSGSQKIYGGASFVQDVFVATKDALVDTAQKKIKETTEKVCAVQQIIGAVATTTKDCLVDETLRYSAPRWLLGVNQRGERLADLEAKRREEINQKLGPEGIALAKSLKELVGKGIRENLQEGTGIQGTLLRSSSSVIEPIIDDLLEKGFTLILFKLQERLENMTDEQWQEIFDAILKRGNDHFELFGNSVIREERRPLAARTEEQGLQRTISDMLPEDGSKPRLHDVFCLTGDKSELNHRGTLFLKEVVDRLIKGVFPDILEEAKKMGSFNLKAASSLLGIKWVQDSCTNEITNQISEQLQLAVENIFKASSINAIALTALNAVNGDDDTLENIPVRSPKKIPISMEGREEKVGKLVFNLLKMLMPRQINQSLKVGGVLNKVGVITSTPEELLGSVVKEQLKESFLSFPLDYWKNLIFIKIKDAVDTQIELLELTPEEVVAREKREEAEVKVQLSKAITKASHTIVDESSSALNEKVKSVWNTFTSSIARNIQTIGNFFVKGYNKFSRVFENLTNKLFFPGKVLQSMKSSIEAVTTIFFEAMRWLSDQIVRLTVKKALVRSFIERSASFLSYGNKRVKSQTVSAVDQSIEKLVSVINHPVHNSLGYTLIEDLVKVLYPTIDFSGIDIDHLVEAEAARLS